MRLVLAPTTARERRILITSSRERKFMSADVMQLPTVAASDDSKSNVDDQQPFGPVICYRDPADVRTIRRQARIIVLCLLVITVAIVGVVYKSIQWPDRIVVD